MMNTEALKKFAKNCGADAVIGIASMHACKGVPKQMADKNVPFCYCNIITLHCNIYPLSLVREMFYNIYIQSLGGKALNVQKYLPDVNLLPRDSSGPAKKGTNI